MNNEDTKAQSPVTHEVHYCTDLIRKCAFSSGKILFIYTHTHTILSKIHVFISKASQIKKKNLQQFFFNFFKYILGLLIASSAAYRLG